MIDQTIINQVAESDPVHPHTENDSVHPPIERDLIHPVVVLNALLVGRDHRVIAVIVLENVPLDMR